MSESVGVSEEKEKESHFSQKKSSLYGTTKKHCEEMVDHSLKRSPLIKFLREAMEKAGCPVGDKFFRVEECNMNVSGGFMPGEGVVICSNHILFQDEVDSSLAHELIHAYDHCRASNLDWSDCRHHACSEIRAANLSTACHMHKEFLTRTSNFQLRAGHQACVKRKALLSVAMNPNCSPTDAKNAVESSWNCCYKDTSPFEKIP